MVWTQKSAEGGIITNANDTPNSIAIGFESGSKLVWLLKAKLKPGEETNTTRKKVKQVIKYIHSAVKHYH